MRREADVDGPDDPEEGVKKNQLSDKTIAHWFEVFRLSVGQEMVTRDKDKKIGDTLDSQNENCKNQASAKKSHMW